MRRFATYCLITLNLLSTSSYGWNKLGHQLVVQIAYDNMTPKAKRVCEQLNRGYGKSHSRTLVSVAAWLDTLRKPDEMWMQPMHYVNIPFSQDGTHLISPTILNAVNTIEHSTKMLKSSHVSAYDKGFHLRVLLHVVGDIHQPMHAISLYSARLPQGDKGGNLTLLHKNRVADNLHEYWDKGGGLLVTKKKISIASIKRKARTIENHWPCETSKMNLIPSDWAIESNQLAVNYAYTLSNGDKPTKQYQAESKEISEQRIALAGCRLAALLNNAVNGK